jgi:hypothetical protein
VDGWINSSKVSGREEEDHKNGHQDSQTCGPWISFLWVYTKGLLYSKKITRPGPPAALDHCSLHSSDKYYVTENVAALGHWLTSVFQPQQ